jgi:hypothetical protein
VKEAEFERRLALSLKQGLAARRLLRRKGMIEYRRRGVPPLDEHRLLWPAIMTLLRQKAANARPTSCGRRGGRTEYKHDDRRLSLS